MDATPARSVEVEGLIGELTRLVEVDPLPEQEFRDAAGKVQLAFRQGGLGPRRQELWAAYQACWETFRSRRDEMATRSREACDQLLGAIAIVQRAAQEASTAEDLQRVHAMARDVRRDLRELPRMLPRDYRSMRKELEGMNRRIAAANSHVNEEQERQARACLERAAEAIQSGDSRQAWTVFKEAQRVTNGLRLPGELRRTYLDRFEELYRELRQRSEQQSKSWREHQRHRLEGLHERIEKTRSFIAHQESCAERCRQQGAGARSDEFAARMTQFAEDHERRAGEARTNLRHMEEIVESLQRRLGA